MDNVLPRALAWSNVTKFEKNDYNRLFGPDSNPNLELYATPIEKQTGWFIASNFVDLQHNSASVIYVFSPNSHEGLNETRVANNKMLLLEGGDGCFDSEGGATNPESNKDKPPTLADVLDEVRALRKEVALSTCSRPDIDNGEVAGHVIGIHKVDGKNDSPNGNQNGVKKGLSCSANDPLPTCSGADILDGEVAGALIGIHKADGKNDSPNVNHNPVNKGLSCLANDHMLTCYSLDMDNGEVTVAGMGIHKADGQNEISNTNDNVVNQGIIGSASDHMLDVLIQVAYDGIGIDKEDGNNDYTDSQCETSTLDVLVQGFDSKKNHPGIDVLQHDTHVDCSVAKLNDHPTTNIGVKAVPVDEFMDDYIDVLNDKESIPNYSLDDMKLQDEEDKLISIPAPVNHQQVDELIDVHQDKTTVFQENMKDLSNKSKYVNVVKEDYKPCLGMVFANVKAKMKKRGIERNYVLRSVKERKKKLAMSLDSPFGQQATTTLAPPKTISRSVNMDFIAPPEFLEDVSGEPKMWSINELITLEVFVEIGTRCPVAWRDIEKVYFLVNEPKKHWCLAELHISTGVVIFYDSLDDNLIHTPALTNLHTVNLKPIGTSHGVWCFSYANNMMVSIANPSIKKEIGVFVPNSQPDSCKILFGFGVHPDNLDLTVAIISYPSSVEGNWSIYVFTFSYLRWDQLDINSLPRESIRFKRSTQAVVGQFIYWVGHERILADSGDTYKHYLLVSFDMVNHCFQVIDIPCVVMRGLSVPLYVSNLQNSLVLSANIRIHEYYVFVCFQLSIDGGSITSASAIMTMPSNHFLNLLGFNNHDLPIVEAATGHIMGHTVQVYMRNSQSFENVAIQGNVGSFFVGPNKESLILTAHLDHSLYCAG
ncbi:hypothetical protein Tco_0745686 [Tanacetum coccineum]